MKRTYTEISCDNCGLADFYKPPYVDEKAMDNGWIVAGRKQYCDQQCKEIHEHELRHNA